METIGKCSLMYLSAVVIKQSILNSHDQAVVM